MTREEYIEKLGVRKHAFRNLTLCSVRHPSLGSYPMGKIVGGLFDPDEEHALSSLLIHGVTFIPHLFSTHEKFVGDELLIEVFGHHKKKRRG